MTCMGGPSYTEVSREILSLPPPTYDVRHAYGAEPSQFGQLRLPTRGEGPWPVACVVHGGYYRARYDLGYIGHLAAALAQDGLATWSIEYRRIGEAGGGWPGTFLDAGAALDALRQLAPTHALDLDQVVTVGHSAGGQLALWLASRARLPGGSALSAADPLRVVGVVALAPVADLERASRLRLSEGIVDEVLGGTPEAVPERYALISPSRRVPLGVPQVVIHGAADDSVPLELSQTYAAAAAVAGDPIELLVLPGADHFDAVDPRTRTFEATRRAVQRLIQSR
jgi:acetyl esterase/lipase